MEQLINKFQIEGLFGYKNINIKFKSNLLIVLGENGFGKTSILNALTFTLQGEWEQLTRIQFKSISITINQEDFSFTYKALTEFCEYLKRRKDDESRDVTDFVRDNLGETQYQKLCNIVVNGKKREFAKMVSSTPFLNSIPSNILYNSLFARLEREKVFSVFNDISNLIKQLGRDILYLPTYRRVEVGLDSLQIPKRRTRYYGYEEEINENSYWNNAVIRFGMEDVRNLISSITNSISQSFITGYAEASGDMIRQLLKGHQDSHELTCDRRQMQIVLARIGNSLTEAEKEHILSMVESKSKELLSNEYLVYFLEQLLSVYKKQERYDSAIKNFCRVCNKYLKEKQFFFDESNVTLRIYRVIEDQLRIEKDYEVELSHLSSGEKQIVSIFAHVLLNVDKRFFILLDEPELSLSIFWQESLIPDLMDSNKCDFIMAVTHSPFIFGEKLKNNTIGISEFLEKK